MADFTRANARALMVEMINDAQEEERFDGEPLLSCGQANLTYLAESAADEFGQADEGGPLDDETHWIWDVAQEAAARTGTEAR